MGEPVRLQLSRRKGFTLQALSRSINGLPAVNCARPGKWGNPHKIGSRDPRTGGIRDAADCVEAYLQSLHLRRLAITEDDIRRELRGKNLACWCKPGGEPCHADVLLEIANPEPSR